MGEIVNRVAQSSLEIFDLEELYPKGNRMAVDLSSWLEEGFLLREKDFRDALKKHDWEPYRDAWVNLYCSTDAVLPAWAYILVSTYLNPVARRVVLGDATDLETALFEEVLDAYDFSALEGKAVLLKGCSHLPVPRQAYLTAMRRIQEFARSVSFGEACSSVPLYKRSRNPSQG